MIGRDKLVVRTIRDKERRKAHLVQRKNWAAVKCVQCFVKSSNFGTRTAGFLMKSVLELHLPFHRESFGQIRTVPRVYCTSLHRLPFGLVRGHKGLSPIGILGLFTSKAPSRKCTQGFVFLPELDEHVQKNAPPRSALGT